ncbi:MAG: flagellar export chaperone FlgN [Oscillospiraceae bacterium]
MTNYNTVLDFFDLCIEHYSELLSFENEKLRLISAENARELGNRLSKEQALIMKGNALEAKRIELMKKEGLEGLRFDAIIENAPDEYNTALSRRRDELTKYINEIKRINGHAMVSVREKLERIEKVKAGMSTDIYDGKGEKKHSASASSSLSKNV